MHFDGGDVDEEQREDAKKIMWLLLGGGATVIGPAEAKAAARACTSADGSSADCAGLFEAIYLHRTRNTGGGLGEKGEKRVPTQPHPIIRTLQLAESFALAGNTTCRRGGEPYLLLSIRALAFYILVITQILIALLSFLTPAASRRKINRSLRSCVLPIAGLKTRKTFF